VRSFSPIALALFLPGALVVACEGSHTDLGVEPSSSSVTVSSSSTTASSTGSGVGGGTTIVEPDGPPKLTLAHGVVDQDAIQFCFLASPPDPADAAVPYPAAPLVYARAVSIALPADPIPAAGDVEVVVLAGDLGSIAGLDCRELADDPGGFPDAIIQTLGVIPRTVLDMQRSLLFVPTGCFALGHDDPMTELVCGEAYTPDTPTPNVVVAPMSRVVDFGAIGLQGVHAISGTTELVDIDVVPFGGAERTIGDDVTFGEIAPFPPFAGLSGLDLEGPASAMIRTYLYPGGVISAENLLGDAMANGGIGPEVFKNGTNVVLLSVGPTPGVSGGSWWSEFTYVALRADP